MGFLSFFTSKMGLSLLSIMGIGLAIWGAVNGIKEYWDDTRENIRAEVTNEVTVAAQREAMEAQGEALRQLQENAQHQNELIEGLTSREAGRARTLDRISRAVQETIVEQGGEQPASPALRQSAQLLAEEWDRLYADKVELNVEPTP